MKPKNFRTHDIYELLPCLLMAGVACSFIVGGCGGDKLAHAGQAVCRTGYCPPRAARAVVAYQPYAVAAVQPVYSTAYYQVGQELQHTAVDTAAFRNSPEYLEYLELRGFARGVAVSQQAPPSTVSQQPAESSIEPQGPPGTPQPQSQPSPPWLPEQPNAFAERYPVIAAHCSRCHSGPDPKGGMALDGSVDLADPLLAASIASQVVNGHMPKNGQRLGPQDEYSLLVELFTEDVDPEPLPGPAPEPTPADPEPIPPQ